MQRPLISPDTTYDYSFDYTDGAKLGTNSLFKLSTDASIDPEMDYMIIQKGRARVSINSGTYTVGMAAPADARNNLNAAFFGSTNGYIAIPITKDATTLLRASVSLLALGYFFV